MDYYRPTHGKKFLRIETDEEFTDQVKRLRDERLKEIGETRFKAQQRAIRSGIFSPGDKIGNETVMLHPVGCETASMFQKMCQMSMNERVTKRKEWLKKQKEKFVMPTFEQEKSFGRA